MNATIQDIVPIFFVLLLGYLAGKKHEFSEEQAEGFNKMVLQFALPALLFTSIAKSSRETLFADGTLFFVAAVAFLAWYFVGFFGAMKVFKHSRQEAGIAGLSTGAPTVGFLGIAVLDPLFGSAAAITVAVASLVVNVIQVPLAMIFIAPAESKPIDAVVHAFKQPIVLAPLLAIAMVLFGIDFPQIGDRMLALIATTTSGVAVFAAGLTLSAHKMQFDVEIVWNSIGKLLLLPAITLGLALIFGITGHKLQELVLLAGLPPAFSGVILASRYKTYVEGAASTLIVSTILFAVTAPLWMYVTKLLGG